MVWDANTGIREPFGIYRSFASESAQELANGLKPRGRRRPSSSDKTWYQPYSEPPDSASAPPKTTPPHQYDNLLVFTDLMANQPNWDKTFTRALGLQRISRLRGHPSPSQART